MSDIDDRIDADFISPGVTSDPLPYSPRRDMLRIIDRCLAILDRIIDESGVQ